MTDNPFDGMNDEAGGDNPPASDSTPRAHDAQLNSEELSPVEKLIKEQIDAMSGRSEADIPHEDNYWKVKARVQQELHKLGVI